MVQSKRNQENPVSLHAGLNVVAISVNSMVIAQQYGHNLRRRGKINFALPRLF